MPLLKIRGLANFGLEMKFKEVIDLSYCLKWLWIGVGGAIGWCVGEFSPAFPLIVTMVLFVCYDAYSAYQLDRRVHLKYPDKVKREEAKFNSFDFSKVIKKTIPERIALILLAFVAEKYVFLHVDWHLEYICTAAILFEQLLSIAENMASCNETDSRFWQMLKKILIDKTERHFELDLDELKDNQNKGRDESVEMVSRKRGRKEGHGER